MTLIEGTTKNYLKSSLMKKAPGSLYFGSWNIPKEFPWTPALIDKTRFDYNPCYSWGSAPATDFSFDCLPLDVYVRPTDNNNHGYLATIGKDMIVRIQAE